MRFWFWRHRGSCVQVFVDERERGAGVHRTRENRGNVEYTPRAKLVSALVLSHKCTKG